MHGYNKGSLSMVHERRASSPLRACRSRAPSDDSAGLRFAICDTALPHANAARAPMSPATLRTTSPRRDIAVTAASSLETRLHKRGLALIAAASHTTVRVRRVAAVCEVPAISRLSTLKLVLVSKTIYGNMNNMIKGEESLRTIDRAARRCDMTCISVERAALNTVIEIDRRQA